tara:strand:- start:196 stop:417 length:222 start_codon:yes stop_codon:yes gene_type:complete
MERNRGLRTGGNHAQNVNCCLKKKDDQTEPGFFDDVTAVESQATSTNRSIASVRIALVWIRNDATRPAGRLSA